ncbi:hypothetical protein AAGW05_10615 [Arthrobacter sp. LAPM80]|uniref:DUF6993 domain-containing protein n=1 Tax=Arthrobacter sp. LAPM80 TaxID=3141788 RepID=UPI00398B78C2
MTLEKMTSRHQPKRHRLNVRTVGASVLLAASLALGGCSMLPGSTPTPEPAPTSAATKDGATPQAKEAAPPKAKTAAEELEGKLKTTLTTLTLGTKAPNREQMMQAMLDAGVVKEKVEVSVDITPTGLAVDAIEAAARVADDCVLGQVRDGNVAVVILPVLASGRCFVGDVH